MSGKSFLDTNVLVYSIDSADQAKQKIARSLLGSNSDLAISAQVLNEFYVVVTRKLKMPVSPAQAEIFVSQLAGLYCVAIDDDLVRSAISAGRRWQLSHWDALIVESARQAGCDIVISEDLANGANYDNVRILNPFTDD